MQRKFLDVLAAKGSKCPCRDAIPNGKLKQRSNVTKVSTCSEHRMCFVPCKVDVKSWMNLTCSSNIGCATLVSRIVEFPGSPKKKKNEKTLAVDQHVHQHGARMTKTAILFSIRMGRLSPRFLSLIIIHSLN